MTGLLLSLAWVAWGIVCFLSGAWLIGPTIYHRQLLATVKRRTPTEDLTPDQIQARIAEQLEDVRVDRRK